MSYADGKHAFGYCDRTGFRYKLRDMVEQYKGGRPTGLRVGKDMMDEDQPQLQLGQINKSDPQSLRHPRPESTLEESRRLYAWNPIGGGDSAMGSRTVGLTMHGQVGRLKVSTG